jgi:hypothetical protein
MILGLVDSVAYDLERLRPEPRRFYLHFQFLTLNIVFVCFPFSAVSDAGLLIHRWLELASCSTVLASSTVKSLGQHLQSMD